MKKKIFLLMFMLLPVMAQANVAKDVAKCALKEGDLDRLSCYDAMAEKHGLSGPQKKSANVPKRKRGRSPYR